MRLFRLSLALYLVATVLCFVALVMAYDLVSQIPALSSLTDLIGRLR